MNTKVFAKWNKCTFCTRQIEYLGFIVSEEGLFVGPTKVKDIIEWPHPTSISEIRGFLGITRWYRTFLRNYALIAAPLTNLLKKENKIDWETQHQESSDELKRLVTSAPCLKLPDFSQPFRVTTDASGIAVGGVLTQENRPVAFTSRKLKVHERNYPTHDLELLAVVHALKKWRHYLLSQVFELVTDHKSLKWIFTQPDLNMQQRRWVEFLQEFTFKIKFRLGKENQATDALSQRVVALAISLVSLTLLEEIQQEVLIDESFGPLIIESCE